MASPGYTTEVIFVILFSKHIYNVFAIFANDKRLNAGGFSHSMVKERKMYSIQEVLKLNTGVCAYVDIGHNYCQTFQTSS